MWVTFRRGNPDATYSGGVTGLAAGASTGQETGWDREIYSQDRAVDTEHDVELLLAFLNTRDVETGTDVLDDEAAWRAWVAERGLGRSGDPRHAREVRNALRVAVGDREEQHGSAGVVGMIQIELSQGVPTLAATDALSGVLAAATRLAVLGYWERFKICPAHDCRWAFFDRSRNRSRTWCSMQVCGNREKARNWRERARGGALTV
ncbi:putative stress-induced transcription regulator [Goodfellowiella coeruleoviolacea]|uniref:Stress-induced transcription regulator n=1 Tax=Goodfellowiella coeruleoviolacea TaxID=334858 RepID=A0AAE3GH61_9PSEU|nr:putative stress-induced transcription regulator [Goodfellowiella coeruleoviolacea]